MNVDDPPCCPDCGSMAVADVLRRKDAVIADLERDLRSKRAQIGAMRANRDSQNEANPYAREAKVVFDYWRQRLSPKAREFKDKRFAAVVARLKAGYTVPELKRAIDGCAARPYVTPSGRSSVGTRDQRMVELELICRSESHVQRFASYVPDVGGGFDPAEVDATLTDIFDSGVDVTVGRPV